MNEKSITDYIASTFAGVNVVRPELSGGPEIAHGDTFFIYDPNRDLEPNRQFPFATIVTKDYGDFDCASNLNRPGVFRLNIGVPKATFQSLFGTPGSHDFAALDKLMPHPVYGAQSWICVLNPSAATFQGLHKLLAEAYDLAVTRYANRDASR